MNIAEDQEKEDDEDIEINPITMLLLQQEEHPSAAVAQDQLHHHRSYHLHSIKSTVIIRQLPSKGLSFQLWPAAAALVSLLDHHHDLPPTNTTATNSFSALLNSCRHSPPLRILELGSGTGLVGIAAAAILGAKVTITDLCHVLPNLKFNAEANAEVIKVNGGSVEVAALGWGEVEEMKAVVEDGEYDIIMGSDVVYHDHLYDPLLQTLRFFLLNKGKEKKKKVVMFVMAHLRRWKKESVFFKKANKDFDVKILHKDAPMNGNRVGVVVYSFVGKDKKKMMTSSGSSKEIVDC